MYYYYLHTVKWFQVFLHKGFYLILIIYLHSDFFFRYCWLIVLFAHSRMVSKHCYATWSIQFSRKMSLKYFLSTSIILFNITHMVKLFQVLLCITNNSFKQCHSLNVKQFSLTHKWDSIKCYHNGSKWNWVQWQWRGTPYSLKLQGWSLKIR